MTKKTAKKKPAAKKAAKKAAKVMADVMDSIIETVADDLNVTAIDPAWMNIAAEPMTTSSPHEMEVFDEDDYNPYAPEGMGGGWQKEPEAIIMPPDKPEPKPVPVEAPSLPAPAPVAGPRPSTGHTVPQTVPDALEGPSDAQIVERLINSVNHFYAIARLTKGAKGPQPVHVAKVIDNIKLARNLITRLS